MTIQGALTVIAISLIFIAAMLAQIALQGINKAGQETSLPRYRFWGWSWDAPWVGLARFLIVLYLVLHFVLPRLLQWTR